MKRKFADLHLRINPKDQQSFQKIINKAARLGYHYVGVPLNPQLLDNDLIPLKSLFENAGLNFVLRANFRPRTQNELMRFLRKFRRSFEIICILCDNKEVARQAAKDRRVDLLNFPSLDYHKRFFNRAEAELACNSSAALEIDVKPILVLDGPPRVRLLSSLRKEVGIALEFHVPIVVSSGIDQEFLMRTPQDLASLTYLFGLNEIQALDTISTNPGKIIACNLEKLSQKFVAPGISVVKEGKST